MFSFHPIIQTNYLEINEWLSEQELPDYKKKNAMDQVNKKLKDSTLESAALQYYVLFPAHSFKVAYALEHIIGVDQIAKWLKYNSKIIVIDVGCGAGAASIAFVNCLLNLYKNRQIQHQISIHFVAIDPNENALIIYYHQIKRLENKVRENGINISYRLITEGHLWAVNQVKEELIKQRKSWGVPFLTHAFLLQANIVSPFRENYKKIEEKYKTLKAYFVPIEEIGDSQEKFGKEEAIAYKQILENSYIDNLHVVTVGTNEYEQRVSELMQAIDNEFQGNKHIVKRWKGNGTYSLTYKIPDGCYWKELKKSNTWEFKFCAEVSSISNVALDDEHWNEIKNIRNLLSAWARARYYLLAQRLVDEVEIRLFESNLDDNLARLQQQLVAYAQDVLHTDNRLHFKFPKSVGKLRPLGLSRIEEEILSTALIQKLGKRISGIATRSYAYKFSHNYNEQNTEYLYENWFPAYSRYIEEARLAAQSHAGCIVIQTDIKSFYTRIIRDNLIQLTEEQLSQSERVKWLLRVLFSRDIDEHEAGRGIIQGNIASGFFANLYLVDLDARFGSNNEWNVKFFRYVDDMIIIVPNPDHVKKVLAELDQNLKDIGLERNLAKTDLFKEVSEFIKATDKDETLDNLQSQFQDWINCLWILDKQHRRAFHKYYDKSQNEWWYRIQLYCNCLKAIGIYIDAPLLSRKIFKYLFNDKLCEKNFSWEETFNIPSLPDSIDEDMISRWKIKFQKKNTSWVNKKILLSNKLRELLLTSRVEIINAIEKQDSINEKRWTRTFRFCINKLLQIGFQHNDVVQCIVKTLLESPWLIYNHHKTTENLAIQGGITHIEDLLLHYTDEKDQMKEYMKAILLRSIRFLPNVSNILWQQVAESSVSISTVTSLMATETWLNVVQKQPELVKEVHLQQIEIALARKPKPIVRLMKNYLLILGKHGRKVKVENNQDYLLNDVYDIIRENDIDSLFYYQEPEILAKEFYSGYRPEQDEPEEAY